MSSGHDCRFYEKTAGAWYYDLETYHRGEYDTFGPFRTFRAAHDDLNRNHSNPGGYSISALPGCKHDLLRPIEHRASGEFTHNCDRCGEHIDNRSADDRRKEEWNNLLGNNADQLLLSVLASTGLSKAQEKALAKLGIPQEKIDLTLKRSAFWWKGVQARLDWDNTIKAVTKALLDNLKDKPLTPVPSRPGSVILKYRAPDYNRTDPSRIVVKNIQHEFAVSIDWFGETINIHAM